MKLVWNLFILTVFTYSESVKGLKLVNNGYEDLYVVIQEAVPESVELLVRIQVFIVLIFPHQRWKGRTTFLPKYFGKSIFELHIYILCVHGTLLKKK